MFFGKKSLGQHFLIDRSSKRKIIEALKPDQKDLVLEIGPGRGELTRDLIKEVGRMIVIEKDPRFYSLLRSLSEKVEIKEGDVLKILPDLTKSLKPRTYKIIGNIPYYITGKIIRTLGDLKHMPSLIVLTTQKEVALRLEAKKGDMNLIAAATQIWAEVEVVGRISKKSFVPQPKVDSGIIRLTPRPLLTSDEAKKMYYSTIKIVFKQPRKTLWNNLRKSMGDEIRLRELLTKLGLRKDARPQDLHIEDLIEISKILNLPK